MPKHKSNKRHYKLINFKAYADTDADILAWWNSITEGERSEALRDLIRAYLGVTPRPRRAPIVDLPELSEVRRDTLWIRDALNDMPAYLERLMQQMVIAAPPATQAPPRAAPNPDPALTDAETQRRTRRMRNASW